MSKNERQACMIVIIPALLALAASWGFGQDIRLAIGSAAVVACVMLALLVAAYIAAD